jgi:excisionase family DNA binding protein
MNNTINTTNDMTQKLTQARAVLAPLGQMASGFLSIREAALITKSGEETIRRAIRRGSIPAYGVKGRLRVRLQDVMPVYVPQRKGMPQG